MPPNNRSAVVQPLPADVPRSVPDPKEKVGDVENEDQPLLKSSTSDNPNSKSDVEEDAATPVKTAETTLWSMKRVQGLGFIVFAGLNFSIASICIKYASHRVTSHETVFWRMIVALVLNYVRWCSYRLFSFTIINSDHNFSYGLDTKSELLSSSQNTAVCYYSAVSWEL
ncbi:unnamed protein product [Phytophthora fragariaefolia]|uniref:Unnamed protein product n=1 Tax=Phytophthora fragariaefolia TaxID=1490495 RepID=A0A9W6XFV9_9STRA|nr:unnamed protein product [Phytophthora fragariaefolia]